MRGPFLDTELDSDGSHPGADVRRAGESQQPLVLLPVHEVLHVKSRRTSAKDISLHQAAPRSQRSSELDDDTQWMRLDDLHLRHRFDQRGRVNVVRIDIPGFPSTWLVFIQDQLSQRSAWCRHASRRATTRQVSDPPSGIQRGLDETIAEVMTIDLNRSHLF